MPVRVDIPTRLKLDAPALTERLGDIEEALGAATGRALQASLTEVLEPRGGYVGVQLNAPGFTWSGDGLGAISPAARSEVEDVVRKAIAAAADTAGLPRPAGGGASTPLGRPPVAPLDEDRYDRLFGLYELPSYRAGGELRTVPVKGRRPRRRAAPHQLASEWWPLTPVQALQAYVLRANQSGIPPPAHGYEGAVYLDSQEGMTIFVVSYPEMAVVFSRPVPKLGLEYVLDPASQQMAQRSASQSLEVSNYWLEPVAAKAAGNIEPALRAYLEPIFRKLLKKGKHSRAEYDAAVEAHVKRAIDEIMEDPGFGDVTAFLALRSDTYSFLVPTGGAPPPPDVKRVRMFALARPKGTSGAGATGAAAGAEGTGAGAEGEGSDGEATARDRAEGSRATGTGVPGGVTGAKPVTAPPAFVHVPGGSTTGSLFPPASPDMDRVELVCKPYLDEPSMATLGGEGKQMQRLVEQIAWRLQIKPCEFAGHFLLNAAEALGGRATQVALWEVTDTGGMQATSKGGGNLGNVDFIPTAGPQIQFLRHLASVVPIITQLKDLIDRAYRRYGDLIGGVWKGKPLSWLNRWKYDFVVRGMDRHVGLIFVMTCNVIFRQLLNTSRENIDKRMNAGFLKQFREVVLPQLVDIDELLRARELLKSADAIVWTMRYGPVQQRFAFRDVEIENVPAADVAAAPLAQTWEAATEAVLEALSPLLEVLPLGTAERYVLLAQDGGAYRIRDRHRRVWDLQALELTIAMRRGALEEVEPLVKQLTDLPEIVERYRGLSDDDADYETYRILKEMHDANAETAEKARAHPWFGFRASTMIESLRDPTIPKTQYALQGIHKQAHEQIGEFFGGDPLYGLAIEELFAGELGRKELASALEFAGIVLLSVICPPAGAGAGVAAAIHHYAEAGERRDIYKSFIDPEKVLSAAEVEAQLFAAKLGLALAIVLPILPELGGEGRVVSDLLLDEEAAVAWRATLRAMTRAEVLLERVIQQGVIETFAEEMAKALLIDRLMSASLEPIMARLQAEWGATGPIGGLQGAMERTLQQLGRERVTDASVPSGIAGGAL